MDFIIPDLIYVLTNLGAELGFTIILLMLLFFAGLRIRNWSVRQQYDLHKKTRPMRPDLTNYRVRKRVRRFWYQNEREILKQGYAVQFWQGISTELYGAVITTLAFGVVLLIFQQYQSVKTIKRDLILQMGSDERIWAVEAARQLSEYGWLQDGTLVEADLMGTNLTNTFLFAADFSEANLSEADFTGTQLPLANFTSTNLIDAIFTNANMYQADFSDADLSDANMASADLFLADLTNADLTRANLSEAILDQAILISTNLYSANLTNASLDNADFTNADLRNSRLDFASLRNAILVETNLGCTRTNDSLSCTTLSGVDLNQANLTQAVLTEANLTEAKLTVATLRDHLKIIKSPCRDVIFHVRDTL